MDCRVKRVITLMQDSLASKLSEQSIARSVNLSASRLRQLFKHDTGLSPIQYMRCLRAKGAAFLLETSFLTIKEVAFQIGAGDVSHFVRDFKKRYGLTPSAYREQANVSNSSIRSARSDE